MRCVSPTYRCHEARFFGGRKDYFQEFDFFLGEDSRPGCLGQQARSASSAEPSRMLEFCHGDVTSGTARAIKRPETRDQRPETRDQRPETRVQSPESRDQRPESRVQRPETRDQSPESRVQRPETRDQSPERGVSVGEHGKIWRSRDWHGRRQATGRGQNIGMAAHWLASLETRAPACGHRIFPGPNS
jgi:hypothetical protein